MDTHLSTNDDVYFPGKISACFAESGNALVRFKDLAQVVETIIDGVRAASLKRDAEIAGLNAKIVKLESALAQKLPIKYLGVHRPGATYTEGSVVTRDGSMFHANKTTRETPGDGCQDWTLCVKHGRDGKDAASGR